MSKNAFKSLGAVLAGLVAIIILSNGTDTLLETTGVFPPVAVQRQQGFDTVWMVMLALVMVVVGSLLASHFYLTRAIFWGETSHFSARGKYG
jgi:hypothetical protein